MDYSMTMAWFVTASSLVVLVYMLLGRRKTRVDERVADLSADFGMSTPGSLSLFTEKETQKILVESQAGVENNNEQLKERIVRAGLYKPGAIASFTALRL